MFKTYQVKASDAERYILFLDAEACIHVPPRVSCSTWKYKTLSRLYSYLRLEGKWDERGVCCKHFKALYTNICIVNVCLYVTLTLKCDWRAERQRKSHKERSEAINVRAIIFSILRFSLEISNARCEHLQRSYRSGLF